MTSNLLSPNPRVSANIGRGPRTNDELWEFVATIWGMRIPRQAVCVGHCAPFDAFADAYFARSNVSVWKASRGLGGKSMLLSTLALTEMVCLGANVTVLGGSGEQSTNVHRYMRDAWGRELAPKSLLLDDPTKRETRLVSGNVARALMASQTSVRGPHPERLRLDEADEMELEIFRAALGQPMSRGSVKSQTVISSTHQYPDGTMTYALEEATKKCWKVWQWCYHESAGPEGWLTKEEIERTRQRIPTQMWETEYELQEPSPEGRAIDTEAVDRMFDPEMGVFAGGDNEYLEFEPPQPGVLYYTGADWAKDVDWTIITTWKEVSPTLWQRVAWERLGRLPWPIMVGRFNQRLKRYRGRAVHDITSIGGVIDDYIEVPPGCTVEGTYLAGKERLDFFTDYISRIENDGFRSPRILFAYGEHKYAKNADLYTSGVGHAPDSVIADACAFKARFLARSTVNVGAVVRHKIQLGTLYDTPFRDPREG